MNFVVNIRNYNVYTEVTLVPFILLFVRLFDVRSIPGLLLRESIVYNMNKIFGLRIIRKKSFT